MRLKRTAVLFLLMTVLMINFTACSFKGASGKGPTLKTSSQEGQKPSTRIITDSCGRQVEIPGQITKVAPSGIMAQVMLYTLCPDKLVGLSNDFSDSAKKYIDKKYWSLPKFGQFYGKNTSLNMEALISAGPDVIIDIGEAKPSIKEDMDGLQKQLGIPVIFVNATLKTLDKAYMMLGDFLGGQEQANILSSYCRDAIADAEKKSSSIPDKDRKTVYYALGDAGLNTNAAGSIHSEVIETVGGVNVANVKLVSSGGGSEVSMEQILKWNPDVIIMEPNGIYDKVKTDSWWQNLKAVKNNNYYEVPDGPFNFMSNPPSVNRIIGVKWLGKLLYPEVYDYDMISEIQVFYHNFYHIELSSEDAKKILNGKI